EDQLQQPRPAAARTGCWRRSEGGARGLIHGYKTLATASNPGRMSETADDSVRCGIISPSSCWAPPFVYAGRVRRARRVVVPSPQRISWLDHRREGGFLVTKCRHVYEALREEIIEGDLLPGERLVFSSLAKRFGVSPIPVREA